MEGTKKEAIGVMTFDWTDGMRQKPQPQVRIADGGDLLAGIESDSFNKGRTAELVFDNGEGKEFTLIKGDASCVWRKHQSNDQSRKAFDAIHAACARGESVTIKLLEVKPGKGTRKVATNVLKF